MYWVKRIYLFACVPGIMLFRLSVAMKKVHGRIPPPLHQCFLWFLSVFPSREAAWGHSSVRVWVVSKAAGHGMFQDLWARHTWAVFIVWQRWWMKIICNLFFLSLLLKQLNSYLKECNVRRRRLGIRYHTKWTSPRHHKNISSTYAWKKRGTYRNYRILGKGMTRHIWYKPIY